MDLPILNRKMGLLVFFAGLFFTLLFETSSNIPVLYQLACLIAVGVLFSVIVLPKQWLIYPIFLLILCMPDLTQTFDEIEEVGLNAAASAWQFFLGPISPAIFVFSCLFIVLFRLFSFPRKTPFTWLFVYFILVVTSLSIYLGFLQESISRFIADAKIPMFFCVGLMIFTSYYTRYPREIARTCQVFVLLAGGHYIVDVLKFFFSSSEVISAVSYSSLSLDSGKGLIMIFSFFALANIIERKHILINVLLLLLTLFVLLAYQTRWLIVCFVAGLLLIGFFLGLKKTLLMLLFLAVFLLGSIPLMMKFAPEVWRIAALRFSFIENLKPGATLEDVEIARAGAIYNSTNLIAEKKMFLTGMGYGSWYTDSYFPMPNLTLGAFDEESLQTGKYYRIHDFAFNFYFKFGLVGIALYSAAFIKPVRRLWKLKRRSSKPSQYRMVSILFIGLLPLSLTYMWFTGKGLLFSSFFIIVAYTWAKLFWYNTMPRASVV